MVKPVFIKRVFKKILEEAFPTLAKTFQELGKELNKGRERL